MTRQNACPKCKGHLWIKGIKCDRCAGTGRDARPTRQIIRDTIKEYIKTQLVK